MLNLSLSLARCERLLGLDKSSRKIGRGVRAGLAGQARRFLTARKSSASQQPTLKTTKGREEKGKEQDG
jgi:hypothetical protein